jgi:hypothetical protein
MIFLFPSLILLIRVLSHLFFFFPFIFVMGGGTLWHLNRFYNVSNISCMNSPPQLFFLTSAPLDSWSSFNTYHFCIYLHVYTFYCTVFILLSSFHTIPPPSHFSPRKNLLPLRRIVQLSCSPIL